MIIRENNINTNLSLDFGEETDITFREAFEEAMSLLEHNILNIVLPRIGAAALNYYNNNDDIYREILYNNPRIYNVVTNYAHRIMNIIRHDREIADIIELTYNMFYMPH